MFDVSGKLSGGRMSNGLVSAGGPAKERPSWAWGEGGGGEARFVVFYEGLRLWEARFVVFYEGLRLWGGRMSKGSWRCCEAGWVAKERPSRAWGEGEGAEARSVLF